MLAVLRRLAGVATVVQAQQRSTQDISDQHTISREHAMWHGARRTAADRWSTQSTTRDVTDALPLHVPLSLRDAQNGSDPLCVQSCAAESRKS
jgi:hypothetical protein